MLILSQLHNRLLIQFSEGSKIPWQCQKQQPYSLWLSTPPRLSLQDEGHRQIWNVLHMDTEFGMCYMWTQNLECVTYGHRIWNVLHMDTECVTYGHRMCYIWTQNVLHMDTEFLYKHKKLRYK